MNTGKEAAEVLRQAGVLSCLASCNEQGERWPWNCEKGWGSVNVLERKGPSPPGPTLLKPTPSAHLPYCPDCFSFLNKLSFLISNRCQWTQEPGISGPSECRSVVQHWAYSFPSLQLPLRYWPKAWTCFLFLSQKPSPSTTQLLGEKLASFCELHLKRRDFLSPQRETTRIAACLPWCFSLTVINSSSDSVFKFFY